MSNSNPQKNLKISKSQVILPKESSQVQLLTQSFHSSRLLQHITAIRKLSDLTVFCLKSLESAFFHSNKITEFSPPEEYIKILDDTAGKFLIDSATSFEKYIENDFVKQLSGISYSVEFFNAAKLIVGEMPETSRLSKKTESNDTERLMNEKFDTERSICSSIMEKIEEFKDDIKFAPDSIREFKLDFSKLKKDKEFENELEVLSEEESEIQSFLNMENNKKCEIDLTKFALDSDRLSTNSASEKIIDVQFCNNKAKDNVESFTFCGSKESLSVVTDFLPTLWKLLIEIVL